MELWPEYINGDAIDARMGVVVVADRLDDAEALATSVRHAGARALRPVSIREAMERAAELRDASMVLVRLDAADALDFTAAAALLAELRNSAAERTLPLLLSLPPALIDHALGELEQLPVATVVGEAHSPELVAEIALALGRSDARVHDVGNEASARRLRQLSEEVGRIARTLASLSAAPQSPFIETPAAAEPEVETPTPDETPAQNAAMLRGILRARRLREQYLPAEVFFDPAWDMLLDLAASRLEAKRVAVSSLCIAAAVPATTALRWIKTMTEEGLFIRTPDRRDGRRIFIDLSDKAASAMERYVSALRRQGELVV